MARAVLVLLRCAASSCLSIASAQELSSRQEHAVSLKRCEVNDEARAAAKGCLLHATQAWGEQEPSSACLDACRFGECMWDEKRARKLAYMLECAVQRRFPRGIRILMQVWTYWA